jgi:hypothetical protein
MLRHRLLFLIFGMAFGLILIELSLRAAGLVAYSIQRRNSYEVNGQEYFTILAFGESTTANNQNGQGSWPEELEKVLNRRSMTTRFRVFNEGIPGTTTELILSDLQENIARYRPDMVITMMGINDPQFTAFYHDGPAEVGDLKLAKLFLWLMISLFQKKEDLYRSCEEVNDSGMPGHQQNLKAIKSSGDQEGFREYIEKIEHEAASCEFHKMLGMAYMDLIRKSADLNGNSSQDHYRKAAMHFEACSYDLFCKQHLYQTYLTLSRWNSTYFIKAREVFEDLKYVTFYEDYRYFGNFSLEGDIYSMLYSSYDRLNDSGLMEGHDYYFDHDDISIHDEPLTDMTRRNYLELDRYLEDKGIFHIAMEYPRQDISTLKGFFSNKSTVVLVSNEDSFNEILKEASYNEIFIDVLNAGMGGRYDGPFFGHATRRGNRLIAENVADEILKMNLTG